MQKHKSELVYIELPADKHDNKDKYHSVFKDGNDSGPEPLRNKYFPEEILQLILTHQTRVLQVHMMLL